MPDRRHHRGAHPADERAFAPLQLSALRIAVHDLSWLLSRGYGAVSSLQLVGNRYRLDERQRMAVARTACSDDQRAQRHALELPRERLADRHLWIDTYNVLKTVESALSGAVILHARDGCYRDLASMQGSFKAVDETEPALRALMAHLRDLGLASCRWLLDSPVSNSARLAQRMRDLFGAQETGGALPWEVTLVWDPDAEMRGTSSVIATADSAVLDAGSPWYNLARIVVDTAVPHAHIVSLHG